METENLSQRVSLALRSRLKTALRDKITKGKDTTPQALPQGKEVAQQSQGKDEAVATQFHLFPYLPIELRLQIWSQATRYKRYVILDPPCNSAAACAKFWLRWRRYRAGVPVGDRKPAWTSRTPPPPLLSVSWEAREVALKTWQLAFGCGVFPPSVVRRTFLKLFPCLCVCVCVCGYRSCPDGFPSCGHRVSSEIQSKHVPSKLCFGL